MGEANSKVDNEVVNETINKTMNQTSMKMVNKTKMSQEELNKINQSIKLISPKETLLAMKKEAAELAKMLCVGNDNIGKCVKDIMDSMVPPACADGLKISQKAEIKSETSAKLKKVDSMQLEKQMKTALKSAYDAQQKGKADASPGILVPVTLKLKIKFLTKLSMKPLIKFLWTLETKWKCFKKRITTRHKLLK